MKHTPRLAPAFVVFSMWIAVAALYAAPPAASRPAPPPRPASTAPTLPAHPRVLIRPADLPRLQARFASHAADFQRIQKWVDANLDLPLEDGSLYLPAFMHLVSGRPGHADRYTRCIEKQLTQRRVTVIDFDDAAAALDWCWDALDRAPRQAFARKLLDNLEPLAPSDSPLDHYIFHPKLCHLAAALAIKSAWLPDSPEDRRVQHVIDAAEAYFDHTLPRYLTQLHGLAPAPAIQPDFEADVAYAAELWNAHTDGRYWPKIAASLRDSCDAYFWSQSDWPGFNGTFVHDAGDSAAETPGAGSNALARATAEILARRTASPIAEWYARIAAQSAPIDTVRELNRRWLHILLDEPGRPVVSRLDAPLARNFGNGWILMRSGWQPGATVIAFDAGQPFWLGRQHYDAGQFQILRKGRLALDSGDDVALEAVPARGGDQGIGRGDGRFGDYAASTVAHNCVLLADPRVRLERDGRDWPAPGNQRLIDGDYKQLDESIDTSDRQTGRLLAFETNRYYSYAAADLARAYPEKTALLFDRHLLFVAGRYLFVMDRIVTERPDTRVTWLLHLPSRPRIGNADLDPQFRRRGVGNTAGAWHYPPFKDWLTADGGEGRLFVRTLLPEARRVALVGGPQTVAKVADGRHRGRSYIGGDENGFEYWLAPATASVGANAWFRLGRPEELGATFGVGAGWGRMEIEPGDKSAESVFINLLIPQDRAADAPPVIEPRTDADGMNVKLPAGELTYEVTLTPRGADAGRVIVRRGDKVEFDRKLTHSVQEPAPVPTRQP